MAGAGPGPPPWRAFIGLGSNLGDRRAHLRAAVEGLRAGGDLVGVSPLYETAPVGGPEDQGPYLNVVVELSTAAGPRELLERCRPSRRRPAACGPCAGARGPSTPTSSWSTGGRWTRRTSRSRTRACGSGGSWSQPLADLAPDLVTSGQLRASGGEVARMGSL